MAANRSIRLTLLENLFLRPRPISAREFERAQEHLFPGLDPFVTFLKTDSYQEMVEHAKTIIARLIFKHHLAPPSRLLFNLLDFEERNPSTFTEGDYIPQDHFVHLAHLYLLGVYLFSYHRTLHRECGTEFNRSRRTWAERRGGSGASVGRVGSYELFSSTWAMFVLYHDLGYPLERILPAERSNKKEWLRPLLKVRKSILKDISLKALSNLVALSAFLREPSGVPLGEMYTDHYEQYYIPIGERWLSINLAKENPSQNDEETGALLENWRKAVFLRGIGGAGCLRAIGTLLPDSAVCAVLEDSEAGEPVVLLRRGAAEGEAIWFQDPRKQPRIIKDARKRLWSWAFVDGKVPGDGHSWKYFALEPKEYFENSARRLLRDGYDGFLRIADRLENDADFKTAKLIQNDSAADLAYTAYKLINRSLGYMAEDEETSDLDLLFASYERGISSVSRAFPSILADCVRDMAREDIEHDRFNPGMLLRAKERSEAIRDLAEYVTRNQLELERRLEGAVSPSIREDVELEQVIRDSARSVRGKLASGMSAAESDSGFFSGDLFDPGFTLAESAKKVDSAGDLDKLLARLELSSFGSFAGTYRPNWVGQRSEYEGVGFADHGLTSALVLFTASSVYKECIERLQSTSKPEPEPPEDVALLRLGFGTTSRTDVAWIDVELRYLLSEVVLAIALHNVFPSSFPEAQRKYRTKLTSQPFAFLALLADGLQKWDRKKLANPAEKDIKGIVPGNRFDLRIKGDLIYISLRASKMDIPGEEQRLRNSLKEYLAGADTLIRLELLEG